MLHKSSTSQGGRDGWLSASESFPLKTEHAFAAFDSAIGGGPIAEGSVGGGTGLPRVQGRDRYGFSSRYGGRCPLHGGGAGPGQLRAARIAAH
jgi:hypothetical protein